MFQSSEGLSSICMNRPRTLKPEMHFETFSSLLVSTISSELKSCIAFRVENSFRKHFSIY